MLTMAYYVYLLSSKKHGTLYLGVTRNLVRRDGPIFIPASQASIATTAKLNAVIPGRREAASPESITTAQGYGFRARAKRRVLE